MTTLIALILLVLALDTCISPFCSLSGFAEGRVKAKFYTLFWGILAPVSVLVYGAEAVNAAGVFTALGGWSLCNWQPYAHHV